MRSFTSLPKKTSPRPSEPLGHPFFRQTSQVSSTSLPRPKTADAIPQSPTRSSFKSNTEAAPQIPGKAAPTPVCPPELAHLKTATPPEDDSALRAPVRPSRDGTPRLPDVNRPHPIVHSGLPKLNTFQHRRKASDNSSTASATDRNLSAIDGAARQTPITRPNSSPRKEHRGHHDFDTSPEKQGEPFEAGRNVRTPVEPPSPDPSVKSRSRFGFFKKNKQEPSSETQGLKSGRRGPAAGTGHEGYGKRSLRKRSGSSSSSGSVAGLPATTRRKSSGASSKDSDLDEFLQQRLSPVYLRGEGRDSESQGRASGSTFEVPSVFTPSFSSPETTHTSASSFEIPKALADLRHQPEHSLAVPEPPPSRGRSSSDHHRGPALVSNSRSPSRKRLAKPRPAPKETALKHVEITSPSSEDISAAMPRPSTSSRMADGTGQESSELIKSKKSNWSMFSRAKDNKPQTKWNFFQRSRPSPSPEHQQKEPSPHDSLSGPVNASAHYLPGDTPAAVDVEDLDNIMREAAEQDDASSACTNFEDTDDDIAAQFDNAGQHRTSLVGRSQQNGVSSSPSLSQTTAFPTRDQEQRAYQGPETTDASLHANTVGKPSRLTPVGRIPPVASRRDRQHKPPTLSFSRPFAQTTPRPAVQSPPPSATSVLFAANAPIGSEADSPQLNVDTAPAPQPFFDFPTRKNSDNSYSSSTGTMHFPTAATIASNPGRNSHASKDETWPEFDDLIDHVLTPSPSASSRQSKQYFEKGDVGKTLPLSISAAPKTAFPRLGTVEMFPRPAESSAKSPSKSAVAVDAPTGTVGAIAAVLREAPSVSTMQSKRSSSFSNSVYSPRESRASLRHKRSNSLPQGVEVDKQDTKRISEEQIIHENPFMFRYRVLMTSKWLSFGRLLFSPIHNELGNPTDRILVIDGLGNRDWSYYCAVSYPQTQIYSLGPSAPSSTNGRASLGNFGNLNNYRHFCYTTPGTDFPFPKGFFAAVVYRFPVTDSDFVMRAMVSECKRVLRPGGYLEISTIDLDLANMGTLARRAVRNLKTDMRTIDQSISLKPTSDHVLSLIGRRGFENLNRCIVGVPAAGVIGSSRENSADGNDIDFGKLANDNSKEGDESITKMVSQVGRWWYTRCYEMGVLPGGDPAKSMWCNRDLLKECEELNTTFKLLICYAQKPNHVKRRTVSF